MLAESQSRAFASRRQPLWRPSRTRYRQADSWLPFRASLARAEDPFRLDDRPIEAAPPRSPAVFAVEKNLHTLFSTLLIFDYFCMNNGI